MTVHSATMRHQEAKRLGLLHEIVPKATTIAVLVNPNFSDAENQLRDVQEAAARLGVRALLCVPMRKTTLLDCG